MSLQEKMKFEKYSRRWFLQILSKELSLDIKALEGTTVKRVKNKLKIGYQSWRPRFLIKIPARLSVERNLPPLMYVKDDVREEEFVVHSKIWELYEGKQTYLTLPQPICFYKYLGTKRGILVSEAVPGKNLNDLFYLSLIPGGGLLASGKVHKLFFRAGQGLGEYLAMNELKRGSLEDNLDLAYQVVAIMPEFNKECKKIIERFLSHIPDELLREKTIQAIDYLPRNLMYLSQRLFFVDLDPIGYRHPSYIGERFIKDTMNKTRYPMIKKSYLMSLENIFSAGLDSVSQQKRTPTENKVFQILSDIFYLGELERSRREYWANGADRFWQKYIERSVDELMDSLSAYSKMALK